MKAFLLAAGLGIRLKPITNSIPKCLVEICGKPLIYWWIRLFEKYNVSQVLINLHHYPEKVINYIDSIDTSIRFVLFYEEKLLGSAGTLKENKGFIKNESEFFVCYSDNLTDYNLSEFYDFYKLKQMPASMALFRTDTPESKGIVSLDDHSVITTFEEKPKNPESNLANAGIYIFQPQILDLIPKFESADIGFDLLPKLIGKISGWESTDYLIDIGTPQSLAQAELDWRIINEGK